MREPGQCVPTSSTGQRRKGPAAIHDGSTAAMPPRVSNAVPSITTMRPPRLSCITSRLRCRAEVAADIQVLHQHSRLAARPARDALDLRYLHVAATLGLRRDRPSGSSRLATADRRVRSHLAPELRPPSLFV